MSEQETNQSNQPILVLQVAMTDDDFGQFILGKPFNPQVLAMGLDQLNESDLIQFQTGLSSALNVLLNTRLRQIADKFDGIQDTEFEEGEE